MLCILYVGTVPTLCILNVGTVPMMGILNEGTDRLVPPNSNTNLAALKILTKSLLCCIACKIQNGCQGFQNGRWGSTPRLLGAPKNFR